MMKFLQCVNVRLGPLGGVRMYLCEQGKEKASRNSLKGSQIRCSEFLSVLLREKFYLYDKHTVLQIPYEISSDEICSGSGHITGLSKPFNLKQFVWNCTSTGPWKWSIICFVEWMNLCSGKGKKKKTKVKSNAISLLFFPYFLLFCIMFSLFCMI